MANKNFQQPLIKLVKRFSDPWVGKNLITTITDKKLKKFFNGGGVMKMATKGCATAGDNSGRGVNSGGSSTTKNPSSHHKYKSPEQFELKELKGSKST